MKSKYIFLIISLLLSLAINAQSVSEVKAKINSIKKSDQYIYADVTSDNEQDARDMAEEELYDNINEWAATRKKLRGSTNFVINNKKELWTELKMPRGNMFRSFLYVKKSDIQGVDNATVINNTNKSQNDESSTSSIEEIYDFQPSSVTIQQGEILLHYDMIAVKSHAEPQRLLSRKGGDFEPQRS